MGTIPFFKVEDFEVVILDFIRDQLDAQSVRDTFMDIVDLRQKLFAASNPKALILDSLDLVSTHIALYQRSQGTRRLVAGIRVAHSGRCREFGLDFPLDSALRHSPLHAGAFKHYQARHAEMKNIGFLCVDPSFRGKALVADLICWLSAEWVRHSGQDSLCCLLNKKFHMEEWIGRFGSWEQLPPVQHPLIPEPHELVLMEKLNSEHLAANEKRYGTLWAGAQVHASGFDRKRQAA